MENFTLFCECINTKDNTYKILVEPFLNDYQLLGCSMSKKKILIWIFVQNTVKDKHQDNRTKDIWYQRFWDPAIMSGYSWFLELAIM